MNEPRRRGHTKHPTPTHFQIISPINAQRMRFAVNPVLLMCAAVKRMPNCRGILFDKCWSARENCGVQMGCLVLIDAVVVVVLFICVIHVALNENIQCKQEVILDQKQNQRDAVFF